MNATYINAIHPNTKFLGSFKSLDPKTMFKSDQPPFDGNKALFNLVVYDRLIAGRFHYKC